MEFSWDERKNRINQRRHRLSFEIAQLVFDDPFALTNEDQIDDQGEMRYQTIGLLSGVLLVVVHVQRLVEGSETTRIISARKAVLYEQEHYWSHRSSES